jgi:hypothetical protein
MEKENLFTEIIEGEFTHYRFMYSYKEKQMIKEGDFEKVAINQLEKIKKYSWVVIVFILFLSGWGIYHFISFGNTENTFSLLLGVSLWILVIILTHLFTKEIISKQNSMKLIIQLLNKK